MLSGDRQGRVQARTTENYSLVLPEAQINSKAQVNVIKVLRLQGEDWMLVGDSKGYITSLKVDPSN